MLPLILWFTAAADTGGTFRIYKLQHDVGAETYSVATASDGSRTIDAHWAFTYIGSDVRLSASLALDADGRPRRFVEKGGTSTLTDVDLSVDLSGDKARITDRGVTRTVARAPAAFPIASYPPASMEQALLDRWRALGRPRTVALLPRGAVSFEPRGRDTLPVAGRRVVLNRYAVGGLVWGRQTMWATADDRELVAVVNGDAELDRFEAVRAEYASALSQFVRLAVEDGLETLARTARSIKPFASGTWALVGARVIDGTGAPPMEDATIVVRGGRIAAVGAREATKIPAGAVRVDGRGKTVIPGLWDMHVHFEQVEWPAAQLAAGVTTARDVGNELELSTALRDAIAAGRALGPRMLLAGLIDGAPNGLGVHLAAMPEDARAEVRLYHEAGCQQIKIYQSVPPGLVSVIAEEAHRLGMTVTGHVPTGMDAIQFVEAGADQINHYGYMLAVMADPAAPGQPRPPIDTTSVTARKAIAFFKAHGTVLDPTLARYEENVHPKDSLFSAYEPGAAHAPPELADALNASGSPAGSAAARMAVFKRSLAIVGALHRDGITMVAGTDLVVPGWSIDRVLELEVEAGFTPMEAIQAATSVPARVMGMDRESGSIAAGMRADLVVLDADPLENISNARKVHAVVTAGRAYWPAPLWRAAGFTP